MTSSGLGSALRDRESVTRREECTGCGQRTVRRSKTGVGEDVTYSGEDRVGEMTQRGDRWWGDIEGTGVEQKGVGGRHPSPVSAAVTGQHT